MTWVTKIIIENSIWNGACSKKYRATPEEIERTEREKRIQRERDQRAQKQVDEAFDDREHPPTP